MKINGKINLLCATESGVSKSTGNTWVSKEVVLEIADGEHTSTMALRTMNTEVIKTLDTATEGDEVEADVTFYAQYREFTRRDGSKGGIRSTECVLRNIKITNLKSF